MISTATKFMGVSFTVTSSADDQGHIIYCTCVEDPFANDPQNALTILTGTQTVLGLDQTNSPVGEA